MPSIEQIQTTNRGMCSACGSELILKPNESYQLLVGKIGRNPERMGVFCSRHCVGDYFEWRNDRLAAGLLEENYPIDDAKPRKRFPLHKRISAK